MMQKRRDHLKAQHYAAANYAGLLTELWILPQTASCLI